MGLRGGAGGLHQVATCSGPLGWNFWSSGGRTSIYPKWWAGKPPVCAKPSTFTPRGKLEKCIMHPEGQARKTIKMSLDPSLLYAKNYVNFTSNQKKLLKSIATPQNWMNSLMVVTCQNKRKLDLLTAKETSQFWQ
jgi:hypothetical protein